MRRAAILALVGPLMLLAAAAQAAQPSAAAAAGKRVAERSCAGCHAVSGRGPSPLPEAPPFTQLHLRYKTPRGLDDLLAGGMLPPDKPLEEGRGLGHFRMTTIALDPDEVANLRAYLRSLEPPAPPT